ncbi:uncharacterized protein LOC109540509 isoform X2 [Dendroctonus ponderosae]|uniref:uncharacterized protein LOC109540509 isoform X2 n=1 Tax=Dendroctonus ponderosae TaxID=77166 RepID=UPI002035BCE0|nr:uncharacterized protein LOC109540509 isoform X2 [Dendroctonus ponderosae]
MLCVTARLFVLAQLFLVIECVSLTYFLKIDGTHLHPICIAEGLERYSAVGWIYPVPGVGESLPNTTVKYIPSIDNDYNCKFSKNDKCNFRWTLKDWQIDETSWRTRQFIDDNRWEDLPTVLTNASTEFEQRFHLENASTVGFSVRALGSVEIILCTGWSPRNYPCYYFHLDKHEIYLNKYDAMPSDMNYSSSYLEFSQISTNIITEDEWRSFEVGVDDTGNITLIDKNNMDRLLISHIDSSPIKPLYAILRSNEPSFWKVIENNFMYTETVQISRLGPQIRSSYVNLCISLFVASCSHCQMRFFYMNGTTRQELKFVPSTNYKWIEIKLKQENFKFQRFNIFIQTEFSSQAENETKGWWGYDEVRICNENEVKTTLLHLNQSFAEDDTSVTDISCQLIKKPNFRPESLDYDAVEDFPPIKTAANDTSITLTWAEEDPDHYITYFIFYQGNTDCPDVSNSPRLKSSGFLRTNLNEVTLSKLIPSTLYNITLSSVLHGKDKLLRVRTLETVEPILEELPFKMRIEPLDTSVNISWDSPNCELHYGNLIYNIIVSNDELKFKKILEYETSNSHLIHGLKSYTKHNLTVVTARNAMNLNNGRHTQTLTYEFSTFPGVAPAVRNLELYAMGSNTASLRYDLPLASEGIPVEVELTKCNVLSRAKCKSTISKITNCTIWPTKLCLDVDYLMPNQNFTFKVSIKNANTNRFGKATEILAETVDRVPAMPENVTHQVIDCHESNDYCNLNIIWRHPHYPNGTIEGFNIILNSTYFVTEYSEELQTIHEVYKIVDGAYLPEYNYKIKYLPYSQEYNLYIQSMNSKYRSDFVITTVKKEELGDHIDQSPKLLGKGDKAIMFKLPHLDKRLDSYTVTVAVQDFNESIPVYVDSIKNEKLADNLCHPYGLTWISQVLKVKDNETKTISITGLDEKRLIKPDTRYCIIFIITNKYRGQEHDVVYYEKLITPRSAIPPTTPTNTGSFNHLYMLPFILLIVPIGFLIYWCIGKRNRKRRLQANPENVYECLPFDERDQNGVNNVTYDQLIHK